tara:strand:- start:442 stop:2370 length:1929 start_codon:yes stop_codon:yes gene_type:complete
MSCGCGCSGEVVAYEEWDEEDVSAAEYQGRQVTLNKPFRTKGGPKKFAVYTKNGSGNVVIVRFGDPNMEIKRDDPERRKSFRARHNCNTPGPKWKARYWSCRQWRGGTKVEAEDGTPCGCGCNDEEVEAKDADDPCTSGYEQYGMKMKNGRKVPNCIPIKKKAEAAYDVCSSCMTQEKCASHGKCMSVAYIEDPEPSMEKALKQAAEPTPKDSETHDEYMSRCMAMNYTKEECMKAHEGHTFKDQSEPHDEEDHEAGYGMKKKKYANECGYGEKMIDGECRKVSVTLDLDFDEVEAIVEASTGNTVIEIRGVAFHEGMNKNKWALTEEGAKLVAEQMKGADLTLNHPAASQYGSGFTRNMDGGVEEAVVGYIKGATFHKTVSSGYEVRYVAHVVRTELFDALESGLWSRENYGVSIGGSGVPVEASEDGMLFGEDFKFDHLAIVHKPAYERATIDSIRKIQASKVEATFIGHSQSDTDHKQVNKMSQEENTVDYEAEIEALKASLVLANSRVGEFEAKEEARVEAARQTLVDEATELGMSGHEDLSSDTLTSLIASWNEAHPQPTEVEMAPVESVEKPVEEAIASESVSKVANYLNGKIVENDEDLYARAWNAWAGAWNKTLAVGEGDRMKAPTYDTIKEMR